MSKKANILLWVFIGVLLAATAVWTVWASHQPRGQSIWAPDSESLPP